MSLINDALKRASSNNKRDSNDLSPMQPAQMRRRNRPGGGVGMTIILICFVIAGAATLGAWAYWNKKYQTPQNQPPAQAAKVVPAPDAQATAAAAAAAAAAKTNNNPIARAANTLRKVEANNNDGEKIADSMKAPVAAATHAPSSAPAQTPVASAPKPVAATAPPTQAHTPTPAQPVATAPAGPKLQAIFFRPNNPTAIINGKTVREGDEIAGGYSVVEIKRQSVRIQKGADARELPLR
jgi:hypothetical protein